MKSTQLFKSTDYCIEFYENDSSSKSKVFVTFTPATWTSLDLPGFGVEYLIKKGFNVLSFKSSWAHYWHLVNLSDDLLAKIEITLSSFQERIGYGTSMGAMGLYCFKDSLKLDKALLLSPQYYPSTKIPKLKNLNKNIELIPHNSKCKLILGFDPKYPLDNMFVQQTGLTDENCSLLSFPYFSHPVSFALQELGLLDTFISQLLSDFKEVQQLRSDAMAMKYQSPQYLSNLAEHCIKQRRFKAAKNLINKALQDEKKTSPLLALLELGLKSEQRYLVDYALRLMQERHPNNTQLKTLSNLKIQSHHRGSLAKNIKSLISYEEIVSRNEKVKLSKKYVFIDNKQKRLIVSLNTFNNKDKYQSLCSMYNCKEFDFLFITNPDNSYYLEKDYGNLYRRFFRDYLEQYGPERVLFFGSSMAGFAASMFAMSFGANALVCNPQFNLEKSKIAAWPNLLDALHKLPSNICASDFDSKVANTCIYSAHGKHPLDLVNAQEMKTYFKSAPHINYLIEEQFSADHSFLFTNFNDFLMRAKEVFKFREGLSDNPLWNS